MLKKLHTGLLGVLLAFGMMVPVFAQEDIVAEETEPKTLLGDFLKENNIEIAASGSLDIYDKYVWRGQYLDNDMVLQPGFALSGYGFTVGYWGSFDLENEDALSSDETDFYISYAYTIDMLTLSAGHTWYDFMETQTSTKEFFVSASLATILTPTIAFYHDYEDGSDLNTDGDGNYYTLSLAQSIPVCPEYGVTLDLSSVFGYVDGQWLSGEGYHVTPKVGLSIPLTESLTARPSIGYNIPLEDLEDPAIGNQDDKFFGGVSLAYSF